MAKLNDLIVTIGAQTRQFDKALGASMRRTKTFGKNIKTLGKNMTMGLTAPIAALGFTAVKAFDEQAKAIAQVDAGLKSTGNLVGFTSKQLQQMASDLQNKTIFGDEEILKDATSQLLTFTNIAGEQFGRTQKVALDLATRLDGDLKSASIQLGKALNDPIANLSALSRSGIQFSEDQKAVIKSLTESGRLAEAQTLILDELEKQYGGSAEAAAKAGTGGLKQLANSFGDLQEEFGKIIMDFLPPVIDGLKNMMDAFKNLSPQVKRFIVIGGGIAAAIGPLLLMLPSIISGLSLLISPIGLVLAAVVGLGIAIVTFADEVAPFITGLINFFITLYNESDAVRILVGYVKSAFVQAFKNIWTVVGSVIDRVKDLGKAFMQVLSGDFEGAVETMKNGLLKTFDDLGGIVTDTAAAIREGINAELAKDPITLVSTAAVAETIKSMGGLLDMFNNTTSGGGAGSVVIPTESTSVVVDATLDIVDIDMEEDVVDEMPIDQIIAKAKRVKDVTQSMAQSMADFIGSAFESMQSGTMTFADAIKSQFQQLLQTLAKVVLKMLVIEGVIFAIQALTGSKGADAGKGIIGRVLKGVGSAFGVNMPALAQGGLAFGPTMAMVGDNQNASVDPEVIAPLSKLQGMMGGASVQVTGKISGRDILLTSERNAIDRNRVRGF